MYPEKLNVWLVEQDVQNVDTTLQNKLFLALHVLQITNQVENLVVSLIQTVNGLDLNPVHHLNTTAMILKLALIV